MLRCSIPGSAPLNSIAPGATTTQARYCTASDSRYDDEDLTCDWKL